jgi:DNA-directed RNA polymerase subunit beta
MWSKLAPNGEYLRPFDVEKVAGQRAIVDIVDPKSGEAIVRAGRRITRAAVRKVKELGINELKLTAEDLMGKVVASPIVNESTGEIIADVNTEVTPEVLEAVAAMKLKTLNLIFFDGLAVGPIFGTLFLVDKVETKDEAIIEIYKRQRPGEPPTIEAATNFFNRLFFDPETYDLSEVGRLKINHRFNIPFEECPVEHRTLTEKDIMEVTRTLVNLRNGKGNVDDIDHLGNRRVRSVGELLRTNTVLVWFVWSVPFARE